MLEKCDICGFEYESTAHFCGKCGVDLTEPKKSDDKPIDSVPPQPIKKKPKSSSKNEDIKNDSIIKWCLISALCNSYQMTFPIFVNLILTFAEGKKHLGFCDCPACNRGYRELLAFVTSGTEKKKLTASSREIVIKARETKIDGMKLDISQFLSREKIEGEDKPKPDNELPKKEQRNTDKITIEIDPDVLENAVFNVLKSEKGRDLIQQIKKQKRKVGV
jgi:hypothetical protein